MTAAHGRSHLPANERLAIVEQETANMQAAVVEIKDAVVGIRSAFERLATVEERTLAMQEKQGRTERWLERETVARKRADEAIEERLQQHVSASTDLRETVAALASTVKSMADQSKANHSIRDMVIENATVRRLLLALLPAILGAGVAVFVTAWKMGAFT